MIKFLRKYWITILIYVCMVFAYIYIASNKLFSSFLFPPATQVVNAFAEDWQTLILNMLYSFELMIPSIVIAGIIALIVGTWLGMNTRVREVVYPVIYSISVIPAI